MDELLVSVDNLSKKFCRSLKRSLWYGIQDMGRALNPVAAARNSSLSSPAEDSELRADEFWALRDISFQVRRGQCIGLIGHNGAGKSTLLKILNGLIRPDKGQVTMVGRVGALIELNAGFNPILSGRENVFHQASLLGFSYEETRRKFDDIVEFSEVGEFLDMPVQNYSSGMRVRLGFAVAAQMEPDVMLIDEVLAVGDVGFRAKCLARMAELRRKCAFIFVSHSMPQIARISTEVMHLDHGRCVLLTSDLSRGLDSYYEGFASIERAASGTGQVSISQVVAISSGISSGVDGQIAVGWGEDVDIVIDCVFAPGLTKATIQLLIWNQELVPVIEVVGPDFKRVPIRPDADGKCRVHTSISGLQLNTGRFSITIIVLSPDGMTTYCHVDQALELRVSSNLGSGSSVLWPSQWETVQI